MELNFSSSVHGKFAGRNPNNGTDLFIGCLTDQFADFSISIKPAV